MRVLAALAVTGLLTGCGLTPPHQASPAAPASPTPSTSPVPATPSAPPPDVSEGSEFTATGQVPRILDPGLIAEALRGIESRSDASRHVFASWPQFGLPRVDAAISAYYTDAIERFDADHPELPEGSAPPELNLGWHLVASSPRAVGIVADGYEFAGASTQERWRSIWFDPATGLPLTTDELVDPVMAGDELASAAARVELPGFDLTTAGEDPLSAASLIAFAGDGSLLIGYDACQAAACSAGRVTVTIAASATDRLLTDTGRVARTATLTPLSPVAPVKPSPEPTPTSGSVVPQPDGKVDCRKARCIALTFDDGPGPFTTTLLSHLKRANVPATFFVLGQQVETYPKVARAIATAGHEIGVHTWDHRMLTRLDAAQVHDEITSSIRIVKQVTGARPTLLRPPYGETNATVAAQAKQAKVAQILWNVDTLDWKTRNTKKTIAAALKQTKRGSILLLHDIHKTSVAAVPEIIEGLREAGYTFVTVSQLLGRTKPGRIYSHG